MMNDQMHNKASRHFQWNEAWEMTLSKHPSFIEAAVGLAEIPEKMGYLHPKIRAFIHIALNANVTHLEQHYLEAAILEALEAGASPEEVIEVLFIASTISVHGMNADVLAEVLQERGAELQEASFSEEQIRIRETYREKRGYWRDFLNDTLRLAPKFLAAYLDFSAAPWAEGILEPKVREFIYLAFDTSPTHLHMTGLRIHMHNALDHGASPEEIVEVMAIAGTMGLQTLDVGMGIVSHITK